MYFGTIILINTYNQLCTKQHQLHQSCTKHGKYLQSLGSGVTSCDQLPHLTSIHQSQDFIDSATKISPPTSDSTSGVGKPRRVRLEAHNLGHFRSFRVISNKPRVPTNWVEACWSMLKQRMLKPCSLKGPMGCRFFRRAKTERRTGDRWDRWDWELRPFFGQSPALLTVLIHVLHTCLWRAIFWSQMLPWSQPFFFVVGFTESTESTE